MTPPNVARIGTAMSHGATLTHGSTVWFDGGFAIVRIGDIYDCPIHGANPMATGSTIWTDQGKPVCRVGDEATCAAVVLSTGASPELTSA